MTKPVSHTSAAHTAPRTRRTGSSHILFWAVGILLFFGLLFLIRGILLPFVVGIFAAYFLDPAVRTLRLRGWSRPLAAGVITFGFFLFAVSAAVILLPLIAHQLSMLVIELPGYVQTLQDKYGDDIQNYIARLSPDQVGTLKDALAGYSTEFVAFAGRMATGALQSGFALLNILLLVFLTPVVAFYLLRDWDLVVVRFDTMLPREHAPVIREQMGAVDRALSGFIRGQTNVCLLFAAYYGIALTFAGLKFGLGLGILTGFFLFVPFVGIATGFVLGMTIALFQFGPGGHLLAIAIVYAIGIVLESSLVTPRLVGSKVGLHPIWIIFGMLSGAALFGFVGILIAVPVTAVTGVLVRFAISRYLHSSLYRGGT